MICAHYAQFRSVFATSGTLANDGYKVWPVANVNQPGFTGLTHPTTNTFDPFEGSPLVLFALGSSVDDATAGTTFDWYISQRTDDPTKQMLSSFTPSGNSGMMFLSVTSLGQATFPSGTEDSLIGWLKDVDVYVRRASDSLIQHHRLLDSLLATL